MLTIAQGVVEFVFAVIGEVFKKLLWLGLAFTFVLFGIAFAIIATLR